jgi:hypothetical protein
MATMSAFMCEFGLTASSSKTAQEFLMDYKFEFVAAPPPPYPPSSSGEHSPTQQNGQSFNRVRDPFELPPQFRQMAKDAGRDPPSLAFEVAWSALP